MTTIINCNRACFEETFHSIENYIYQPSYLQSNHRLKSITIISDRICPKVLLNIIMTKQHPVTVVHKSWNVIEQKNKETKGSIATI